MYMNFCLARNGYTHCLSPEFNFGQVLSLSMNMRQKRYKVIIRFLDSKGSDVDVSEKEYSSLKKPNNETVLAFVKRTKPFGRLQDLFNMN
jgi:hypothetical protein